MTALLFDTSWKSANQTGVEVLSAMFEAQCLAQLEYLPSGYLGGRKRDWLIGGPIRSLLNAGSWTLYTALPPNPLVMYLSKRNICFVHDLVPLKYRHTMQKLSGVALGTALSACLKKAHLLLCATEKLRDEISGIGRDATIWRPQVDNRYDLAFKKERNAGLRLVYIGTLEPRKNIPYLLKAFARLRSIRPEAKLTLAGRFGWGSTPCFPGGVEWVGYASNDRLKALLEQSDLLITCSVAEGICLPILEAGFAGLPVACFRDAIPNDVLPRPAVELCGDPDADAKNILRLVTNGAAWSLARQSAFVNTEIWNRSAKRSNEELCRTLEALMRT